MLRNPEERELALKCLELVFSQRDVAPTTAIKVAQSYFAFVSGDDAKARLDADRAAVS